MAVVLSVALLVTVAAAEGGTGEQTDVSPEAPAPELSQVPVVEPLGLWDRLAECESNQHWHANTGNGYFGGLQEDRVFWANHGGLQYASRPDLASREAQIAVARVGQARQGWAAWPICSRRLGLR
jgi:hypothetical protein